MALTRQQRRAADRAYESNETFRGKRRTVLACAAELVKLKPVLLPQALAICLAAVARVEGRSIELHRSGDHMDECYNIVGQLPDAEVEAITAAIKAL